MSCRGKVLILGADGYLGWSLYIHLQSKGCEVSGVDNYSRRQFVNFCGSESLVPIPSIPDRQKLIPWQNVCTHGCLHRTIAEFEPDVIIHLAEQPSAPFSMTNVLQAAETQANNILGTMQLIWAVREINPKIHIIKLGTMGEYSDWIYKSSPIPESTTMPILRMDHNLDQNYFLDIPTPKFSGSFYHMSKIFDSYNIEFACKMWGLRATDINQGVVYGSKIEAMDKNNRTRFDYDSYFGTAVNRFIVQAIQGLPLTVYGKGGQTRGYININDVMRAIELVIENPAQPGELQIVNQLTEVFRVEEIAELVASTVECSIGHVENPRVEKEQHSYKPVYQKLYNWGLTEPRLMKDVLPGMVEDIRQFKDRINVEVILPKTKWREKEEEVLP